MWKKIDIGLIEKPPVRLEETDHCYHAREYTSGGGFAHSETNNLVSNFKMRVEHRGRPRWRYKEQAIAQFATEAASLLTQIGTQFVLAPIPSSKRRDDAQFDDRLEVVTRQICHLCSNAIEARPVIRETTIRAAHESGSSRPSVAEVRDSLAWEGLPRGAELVIFLDDVLTSGTTFKECQRLVLQNESHVEIIGMFWARTVWQ